jgi:hypothetical protein
MWMNLVVVDHPPMRCLALDFKVCEEVLVQDLLTERLVEAFYEGVLVGLARLDVSQRHAAEFGPLGSVAPKASALALSERGRQILSGVGLQHRLAMSFLQVL